MQAQNPPNIPNFRFIACVKENYKQKGNSPGFKKVIMLSWKPGAGNKYNTYQKHWIQFSSAESCFNFLHSSQICNVGYSVLNATRCILSCFVDSDEIEVGKDPGIC